MTILIEIRFWLLDSMEFMKIVQKHILDRILDFGNGFVSIVFGTDTSVFCTECASGA